MPETLTLPAKRRTILGKQVSRLRAAGEMPAVMYGRGFASESLSVTAGGFKKIYAEAGTSALVSLAIEEDKPLNVLLHEPTYHPTTGEPLHADFYRVRMDEKITTELPIVAVGESPAVLELEGSLVQPRDTIEIETLPGNLIPEVEVDISRLKTFEDQIRVGDLKLPETIEVLTDPEEVLFMVQPPRSEEEMAEELADTSAEEAEAVEALNAEKPEESAAEESKDKEEKAAE